MFLYLCLSAFICGQIRSYHSTTGIEAAQSVPGITEVIMTAKQGQRIIPLPEGKSYLGFIFAQAPTPAEAEQSLRTAQKKLTFEILPTLPVLA